MDMFHYAYARWRHRSHVSHQSAPPLHPISVQPELEACTFLTGYILILNANTTNCLNFFGVFFLK